jgi:hypothetical protein
MRKTLAFIAAATALLGAATAEAGEFDPWFATSRAGGYVDFWPAESFTGSLFGAELQLRVARRVFLDMSFSASAAQADFYDGGKVKLAYANPTIGAHFADQVTPSFAFFVGGTFTVPLLHDPASDVALAARVSAPIRGFYDLDRLAIGHLAVRAMGGIEWNFVRPLYLRAELRPVVYVPTRDISRNNGVRARDADFFLETAVEFEGRLQNGFGAGARLQAVGLATADVDQGQVLFEPFIAVTPRRRGFYMRLGFPLALDEPLGFGFDENKLAAFRIALGGQF